MKRLLFFSEKDAGIAIIAVVLTIALVLALFVMAFTNGMVGRVVTDAHTRERTIAQCGQGAIQIANEILVRASSGQNVSLNLPVGVAIPNVNNFLDEVYGNTALAIDTPVANPNITVQTQDASGAVICMTFVDVDYLLYDGGSGESKTFLANSSEPIGGTACGAGTFYSIVAVTQVPGGGTSAMHTSSYFKCPN